MTDLFQEKFRRRPFWLLAGCILANRTRWVVAEPVHAELMRRWPKPELLATAAPEDLVALVAPLGLTQRAVSLKRLADTWTYAKRHRVRITSEIVRRLPGCGDYAADSWAIFVEGRRDVEPTDTKLRGYLRCS